MMKKKHLAAKCIAAALSVVITAGAVTYHSGEALSAASNFSGDSKVKGYEDQIKKADANIAALKNQIASSKQDLASAQADKEAYDKLVASYMEKIAVTNDLIAELEASIAEKTNEISGKQSDYRAEIRALQAPPPRHARGRAGELPRNAPRRRGHRRFSLARATESARCSNTTTKS